MIERLNDLEHPALRPYRNLVRSKRTRCQDWFIAEGRLIVERLLAGPHETLSIVIGDQVSDAFRKKIPETVPTFLLPDDQVSQLVGYPFHAGIIACGRRPRLQEFNEVPSMSTSARSMILACPAIALHDNLGAIIRVGAAFGVDAIVVGSQSVDPWSRRVVRVSMGNIFQVPIVEPDSVAEALSRLQCDGGYSVIAATGAATASELPLSRPADKLVLVLGHEADGVPEPLLEMSDCEVSIPMSGATDSLNVTHAAAILLYEFTLGSQRGAR